MSNDAPKSKLTEPETSRRQPKGEGAGAPRAARKPRSPKGEAPQAEGTGAPPGAPATKGGPAGGPAVAKERKEGGKGEAGAPGGDGTVVRTHPVRLRERYRTEVVPRLRQRFGYRNIMEVPRLEKVVINMRVGDATTDTRFVDKAVEELTLIAGQRPAVARARVSIAAFKLRRGMPIAARVTLRGDRMYEFVDKLFNVALPRIKDFRGISERQFDGRGNLNIGVREQLIFPEIDYDRVEKIRGMDITLVTTARTDEEAQELLRLLGLPLREAAPEPVGTRP